MRTTLRRLTLTSITALALQTSVIGAAMAQTILFAGPDGMKLANGTKTSPSPILPWSVAQYAAPEPLPPFTGDLSRDASAAVEFYPAAKPSDQPTLRMRNTSYSTSCVNAHGSPTEQDLFLEGPPPAAPPVVTALSDLVVEVNMETSVSGPNDQQCMGKTAAGVQLFNSVELSVDFNISDAVTGQKFSYGVVMGQFGAHDGDTVLTTHLPPAKWFQKGPIAYGYDEPVSDFIAQDGVPLQMLSKNVMTPYNFDVLPNIEAVIDAGFPYGMDPNLADWTINGVIFGAHDFGHTQITGWERGLQVVAK